MKIKSRSSIANARRGAALAEFAICLPIFFLITMGTIETCRMIYLRQSLKIAAYETARLGLVPGITDSDLQVQCDAILQGRNLKNYQLLCNPVNRSQLSLGDHFTAKIEIVVADNLFLGSWFYPERTMSASVTMMAEH